MKKALIVLAGFLAVQALLVVVYLGIERERDGDLPSIERLTTAAAAADIVLQSPDGKVSHLSERRGSSVVLHFWATWCAPCREELPSLLAFASSTDAEVLAVSVDPEWATIRSFVGEGNLDHVYRASADDVRDAFGVDELPRTFVIDSSGTIRLRFRGAQPWESPAIRAVVDEATE